MMACQNSARVRSQLLREPGSAADPACLADELRFVAERGNPVRTGPNLWRGVLPERFDLVQQVLQPTHQWHRYRLTYAGRVEHVLVGITPERRIH